jgi:hypothetical protein
MGFRCSLLGHDWSETEREDERDQQGNEVVITVRKYEACARCGDRTLISENTEVTTVDIDAGDDLSDEDAAVAATTDDDDDSTAPDDATMTESDDRDAGEPPADEPVDPTADEPVEPVEPSVDAEDAVIIDADSNDDGEATPESVAAEAANEPTADIDEPTIDESTTEPHEDASTDDGVILDETDEPVEHERGHGEWPAHDTGRAESSTEARAWPDHGDADAGYDAPSPDSDAADVDFDGTLTPQSGPEVSEEGFDAEFIENATGQATEDESERERRARHAASDSPAGIASASEVTPPTEGTATAASDLVCPACGNSELASRTSLRAGDICPECKRGYLAESNE